MKPLIALTVVVLVALALWSLNGRAAVGPPVSAEYLHDQAFLEGYKRLGPKERKLHDPVSILALAPNQEWSVTWPEHPAGRFTKRTNERGFLEDGPTPLVAPGPRVLVLGDSHTEGVVGNAESFANVLETHLRARAAWRDVDVINAGVGYSGPYVELSMLRKQLELEPDVVVAAFFTGNDFWEDLLASYLLAGERPPNPGADYFAAIVEVKDAWSAAAWQGVNQIVRFRRFPAERTRALAAVVSSFERMQALCERAGMHLVVLILPTKLDVDDDIDAERLEHALRVLQLTPEELHANAELGAELRAALLERGIDCVDTTPTLRAEPEACYWTRDHHLNVRGHALVARVLEEHLLSHNALGR